MKISSFCIACCLWAAASFCTEAAAGADEGRRPAGERGLELELELARRSEIYLVLDTAGRRLAVKARGLELAAQPLDEAVVARYRRRGDAGAAPAPSLPAVLEVREGDSHRRRIVVARSLRPYPADEAARDDGGAAPLPAVGSPDATPPAAYRVRLDAGWELWIGQRRGGPGTGTRFDHGLADLWARLRGRPPAERTVVALALAPEGARRLHHLLRPGARLLVR